ncbi:MAG TPA: cobalamin-independent methionine synthase II family protein [Dehalococcoidia bacterium]|nr:cobalamin-independent methionine synthase II family protein [Dehalococcoidia bacterium]
MKGVFRADHVGSLLRPPELLQARTDFADGRITREQLTEVEDASVLKALDLQKQAGISVFTEGEYRRSNWAGAVRSSIDGLVPAPQTGSASILGTWQGPHGELATSTIQATTVMGPPMVVGEKIRQKSRLAGEEASFLAKHAPGPWKITMPGAMSAGGQLYRPGVTDKVYTREEFTAEIAKILQAEVEQVIAEGCSYVQIDSLHYVERLTYDLIRDRMIAEGEDPDAYLDELIAVDNSVLDVAQKGGVTVGMHMCRGNNRSAWHAEGSYEGIAEKAFQQLHVDRFLLEYDTSRAGGFEPLRFMPKNKMVVLGLISSKEPALESIDDLRRRIDEAAKYVPIENLAISPQCGFASTALGNLLTWDQMKAKLELVAETAQKVWG